MLDQARYVGAGLGADFILAGLQEIADEDAGPPGGAPTIPRLLQITFRAPGQPSANAPAATGQV